MKLTAVFDAQYGGFTTDWSPVSWGSIDELFVNLTMPWYVNNRAEVSHQPTRQRERQLRRFKLAAQLQRFASVHGIVRNLFRVGRHLLRLADHRLVRTRAFVELDAVTCAR